MSNSFNLMETNPNLATGSNGCLCHELGGHDTAGPFVVFIATETDNIHAPFPVLCAGCALVSERLVSERLVAESTQPPVKIKRAPKPSEDGPTI